MTTSTQRYRGRDLSRALTIDDLRCMAQRALPRFLFEYIDGGAEDGISQRRNREVFERLMLVPNTVTTVQARNQSSLLLGAKTAMPLVVAPTGFNGLSRHRADVALAKAAAAAGVPFALSMASNTRLEDVVSEAGGRLWMQLYWVRNRDFISQLVERAARAGYEALVITTDVPVPGGRETDRRNYSQGMQLDWRNKLDVLAHPRWLWDVPRHGGLPRFANLRELIPDTARNVVEDMMALGQSMAPQVSWDDIRWLRSIWSGKLLVKGILAADDARRAADLGADGIILSNHGGRQLDGAISGLDALPPVRQQLGSQVTLIVDGGIRRGTDVIKAMALGADAVMTGRPTLYGVAAGGEPGARRALAIFEQEIDRGLALLGRPDINALDADIFFRAIE